MRKNCFLLSFLGWLNSVARSKQDALLLWWLKVQAQYNELNFEEVLGDFCFSACFLIICDLRISHLL